MAPEVLVSRDLKQALFTADRYHVTRGMTGSATVALWEVFVDNDGKQATTWRDGDVMQKAILRIK